MTSSGLLIGLLAALAGGAAAAPTPRTVAALDPAVTAGRGAIVPFDEYEAENGRTNGAPVGPGRTPGTLAAEASGRRAVRLRRAGDFIEITLARSANALTVRYALADAPAGGGRKATLSLFADGRRLRTVELTSRYSWLYGHYPFSNRPADGRPRKLWDSVRVPLDRTLPAGARLRLQVGDGERAAWCAVDLVDAELIPPPLEPPEGAVSVLAFGADPTGRRESGASFEAAIRQARGGVVWVPPGTFRIDRHLVLDRVTLAGAGMWRSTLTGRGLGLYGRTGPEPSRDVQVRDLALIGEVDERRDELPLSGVGGGLSHSVLERLWIQHQKTGVWLDGPISDLRISGLRISDTTADGINLHRGVANAVVEDNFIRGVGDDGIAAWSEKDADHDVTIRRNTVIAPTLANGIAIYGGRQIAVADNLVADTVTEGGGLHLGNRFKAVPASGRISFTRNTAVRSGSFDVNWRFGVGAVWLYALDAPLQADVQIADTTVLDPTEEALTTVGKPVGQVVVTGLKVDGLTSPLATLHADTELTLEGLASDSPDQLQVRRCTPGSRVRRLPGGDPVRTPPAGC